MFNNRVSRYRLMALLMLVVLVLFGLGAGDLATRALAASTYRASAVISDSTELGDPCGLKSDGTTSYDDGVACVDNYVLNGGVWRLQTPSPRACSPAVRKFTLVLGPSAGDCTGSCCVAPDPAFGGAPLNLCGSNVVSGQIQASALFSNGPNRGTGMTVYIPTDPPTYANYGFELDYQQYLTVIRVSSTERIVTTDNASPLVDLYTIVPLKGGGWTKGMWLGTFSVPCRITVKI
jgi:hypothetical protein